MAESPPQTAFAEEALSHLDTLYRGALRLTRDPDAAQDLVQEAYLRALRYQHSYQPGTNMKAWLFAIMRNLFWDRFKGSRKEDVSLDDVGEFILYDKLRDEGARPEADVLDKLAASEVVAAVEKLPPLHREVVLLVDVEGFSYKDAAQTLGIQRPNLYRKARQLGIPVARDVDQLELVAVAARNLDHVVLDGLLERGPLLLLVGGERSS